MHGPSHGADVSDAGVAYRVWAPKHATLHVQIQRRNGRNVTLELTRSTDGFFTGTDAEGVAGDRYWFELPDGMRYPDVASRYQPEGVHGPSECVDARAFHWRASQWSRPPLRNQVIYELHVGTFTPAGTFRAAIERLDHVRALGATAIEIMPVADFSGQRNWGYDGVMLYAPARCYGSPDDFRALIDAAHLRGLAVILDVVYNHLGPDGNYLEVYSDRYFHASRKNPWGRSFNLDGENSRPVRDFFVGNAAYWLDEFRIDGLRLDATHAIEDPTPRHVLAEIAEVVHARGGFVIAEDERNTPLLLCDEAGTGHGLDAVWSDDAHHQLRVALTQVRESYFGSYSGAAADIAETLRHGWTYIGQPFPFWHNRPRGGPCQHLPPDAFVYCIENHDQVGNRAFGERLEHLVSPAAFRAASALLCLSPYTPLIFMGQEWAARTPFLFFTDHQGELGRNVSQGRLREFAESGLNSDPALLAQMPDPQDEATFQKSKLNWDELVEPDGARTLALYRECLQWRAQAFADGANARAFWRVIACGDTIVLRFFPPHQPEWLLVVNLHGNAELTLAEIAATTTSAVRSWRPLLCSEEERFSGRANELASTLTEESRLQFSEPAAWVLVAAST